MIEYNFFEPIYRRWLVVVIGSHKDFIQFMQDGGYKHMDAIMEPAVGMHIRVTPEDNYARNNASIIWLSKWDLSYLVHEITHNVIDTFDALGLPISIENTEGMAFYSEYWYKTITDAHRTAPKGITPAQALAASKPHTAKKRRR